MKVRDWLILGIVLSISLLAVSFVSSPQSILGGNYIVTFDSGHQMQSFGVKFDSFQPFSQFNLYLWNNPDNPNKLPYYWASSYYDYTKECASYPNLQACCSAKGLLYAPSVPVNLGYGSPGSTSACYDLTAPYPALLQNFIVAGNDLAFNKACDTSAYFEGGWLREPPHTVFGTNCPVDYVNLVPIQFTIMVDSSNFGYPNPLNRVDYGWDSKNIASIINSFCTIGTSCTVPVILNNSGNGSVIVKESHTFSGASTGISFINLPPPPSAGNAVFSADFIYSPTTRIVIFSFLIVLIVAFIYNDISKGLKKRRKR